LVRSVPQFVPEAGIVFGQVIVSTGLFQSWIALGFPEGTSDAVRLPSALWNVLPLRTPLADATSSRTTTETSAVVPAKSHSRCVRRLRTLKNRTEALPRIADDKVRVTAPAAIRSRSGRITSPERSDVAIDAASAAPRTRRQ
jgi:hypothetical protein